MDQLRLNSLQPLDSRVWSTLLPARNLKYRAKALACERAQARLHSWGEKLRLSAPFRISGYVFEGRHCCHDNRWRTPRARRNLGHFFPCQHTRACSARIDPQSPGLGAPLHIAIRAARDHVAPKVQGIHLTSLSLWRAASEIQPDR
jgi:hypothetical protein